jgi:hemerythrin-like domain-containing protein
MTITAPTTDRRLSVPDESLDRWIPGDAAWDLVAVDLYRDIHKGIRSELFSLTESAGWVDPGNRDDRMALVDHVRATHSLLESHAHHEDAVIQPVLERELPDVAERIERDHVALDMVFARIADVASSLAGDRGARRNCQLLHLDLARFTADYLVHIDIEERVLMPSLEQVIGVEAVLGLNAAIISSIPPEEMGRSLALMLPAMNLEDRCELLGGMQAGAPPEVFAGVIDLARSVLRPEQFQPLATRLELS